MSDFNFVNSRIAVGAAINSPEDVQLVVAAGITHVVDCREEFDDTQEFAANPSVSVLWIGVPDDGQPKPVTWFQKGIEFGLAAIEKPNARCLFHCAAGVNRGPSMCYAFLRSLGFSGEVSEAMIRKARPQVGLAYKNNADVAISVLGY